MYENINSLKDYNQFLEIYKLYSKYGKKKIL